MGKTINSVLAVGIISGTIALSGCNWYRENNIGMTRQEYIREDCHEKSRNPNTTSYSKCVSAGYAREAGR